MGMAAIPKITPNHYYVPMICVLKIQKDKSTTELELQLSHRNHCVYRRRMTDDAPIT